MVRAGTGLVGADRDPPLAELLGEHDGGGVRMVLVRYFAGARVAAGRTEEKLAAGSLTALVTTLSQAHGPELARVLSAASFLVDGVAWRDRTAPLPEGATVDVLPPFAGG